LTFCKECSIQIYFSHWGFCRVKWHESLVINIKFEIWEFVSDLHLIWWDWIWSVCQVTCLNNVWNFEPTSKVWLHKVTLVLNNIICFNIESTIIWTVHIFLDLTSAILISRVVIECLITKVITLILLNSLQLSGV
jgi:hypothetical protein